MKARLDVQHLDLIATAPQGVKRLRELILELAVRGKLVPQDPNDEPASELLKRIAKERARLEAEGKIKKSKQMPPVGEDEQPFLLPRGWEWIRLSAIGNIFNGNSINSDEKEAKFRRKDGLPYIATKDVGYGLTPLDYENGVRIPHSEPNFKMAHEGAVFICAEGGSAGKKCGLTDRNVFFGNKLFANETLAGIPPRVILYIYLSPFFREQFASAMTGIIGGVSIAKFVEIPIPLPPLAEQHRIVAKVDELMALCDRLEAQQDDAASAHSTLVKTLLDTLTQSGTGNTNADDFTANWQRLAQHFDTLFTTEASIAALKQTLLQLAVMGKLVPQDPNDEPASELLKRIQAEKAKIVAEGKIKQGKPLPEIGEEEMPFELPVGWEWVHLESLTLFGPTNGLSPKPSPAETRHRCLTLSATTRGYFIREHFKHVDISDDDASKFHLKNGDLLIQRANSLVYVGMAAVYDQDDDIFIFPDLMMRLRLSNEVHLKYVLSYLNSRFGRSYFMGKATGTQGNMPKVNQGTVSLTPIPIPPLHEQHRITAKVDELMALCDQLTARLKAARELSATYATAATEAMLEAA
jgi:type I restriction enzyme S subunit